MKIIHVLLLMTIINIGISANLEITCPINTISISKSCTIDMDECTIICDFPNHHYSTICFVNSRGRSLCDNFNDGAGPMNLDQLEDHLRYV